jgi:hypothetical protein
LVIQLKSKLFLIYFFFLCTVSLLTKQASASIWNTNDDPTMLSFVDGSFSGENNPIMVFEHPFIGFLLSALYKLFPATPWYPVFLTVMVALALALVIVLCDTPVSKIFSIVLAVSIIIRATQNPSFSISAVVVVACALWIAAKSVDSNDKFLFAIASTLLLTGVMIRSEAFFLALLIISPVFLWVVIFAKDNLRQKVFMRCVLALALFFSLQIIVNQTKFFCVSGSDCASWKTYSEYNKIRGDFQGSSRIDYLETELDSIGWSKNDFDLFHTFNNPDTDVFGLESLIKADRAAKEVRPLLDFLENPLASSDNALSSLQGVSVAILKTIVLSMFGLLVVVAHRRKYKLFALLLLAPLSYWVTISIASGIRLPERILIPATYTFALTLLWFFERISSEDVRTARKHAPPKLSPSNSIKATLVLFVAGMFISTFNSKYDFFYLNKIHQEYVSRSDLVFEDLKAATTQKSLVASGSTANVLLSDPWVTSKSHFDNRIIFLGWPTFSPHFFQRKEKLGISDLFLEIAEGKIRYYGCTDYQDSEKVAAYIKEHYAISGKFRIYSQPTKSCAIYDFIKS